MIGGVDREKDLHADILEHCKLKRWVVFHGSMAHRAMRTPLGEPDFCIAMPAGRVIWIEAKTKSGKLSQDQVVVHHCLKGLGHAVVVVRSMAEFLEAVA